VLECKPGVSFRQFQTRPPFGASRRPLGPSAKEETERWSLCGTGSNLPRLERSPRHPFSEAREPEPRGRAPRSSVSRLLIDHSLVIMSARLRPLQRATAALLYTSRPALQARPPHRHLPALAFSSAAPRSAHDSAISAGATPKIVQGESAARTLTVELPNGQQTSLYVASSGPFPWWSLPVAHSALLAYSHYLWLRDHCREARSYHPATKQRLVDTFMVSGAASQGLRGD